MRDGIDRRHVLRLATAGDGLAFASGLGFGGAKAKAIPDFYFVQMTDTHWGYAGPANPETRTTLPRAVAAVNALDPQPDFIIFTGDLTHTTDDPAERRRRMAEFKSIAAGLKNLNVRYMPGEHDASLDRGEAYRELFGAFHYSFDHKGVHFIALDNTTDAKAFLGEAQLAWLAADLATRAKDDPIVVLAHRPLFPLKPDWDWATADGDKALALLAPYGNAVVFYGHIHQEHHHTIGQIAHHAAASLLFPLTPLDAPKKAQVPWDAARPFHGLGFRQVRGQAGALALKETAI
jgi:predicted phosphodiesterase